MRPNICRQKSSLISLNNYHLNKSPFSNPRPSLNTTSTLIMREHIPSRSNGELFSPRLFLVISTYGRTESMSATTPAIFSPKPLPPPSWTLIPMTSSDSHPHLMGNSARGGLRLVGGWFQAGVKLQPAPHSSSDHLSRHRLSSPTFRLYDGNRPLVPGLTEKIQYF